jgi:hypothetical protein
VFAVLQLIIGAGLCGFAFRLILRLRARRRSKMAGLMMARTLRTSIRSQNAHQAIASLREKRNIEVYPLESAMASRADLCQRIDGIRERLMARAAASGARRSDFVASSGSLIGRLAASHRLAGGTR